MGRPDNYDKLYFRICPCCGVIWNTSPFEHDCTGQPPPQPTLQQIADELRRAMEQERETKKLNTYSSK